MEQEQQKFFELSGLKLCFIGMLFALINIRIGGFDLLPDVIGYLMIVTGLGRLEQYSAKFSTAKMAASVLVILSLFNIIQFDTETSGASGIWGEEHRSVIFNAGVFGHIAWIGVIMLIAGTIVNLVFTFYLCGGMKDLCLKAEEPFLAQLCKERWNLILISQAGLAVSMLLAFLATGLGTAAVLAFVIFSFIAGGLLLHLIYEVRHRIDGKEMTENE